MYEHYNFGGQKLTVYGQIGDLNYNAFNDKVSSAKVYGSCQWIFYADPNYQGDPSVLSAGSYSSTLAWGKNNDVLSSLRAVPPQGTTSIALFEHSEFSGKMLVLYGSASTLGDYNYHDIASSAIVTGGTWELYEHSAYTGTLLYTLSQGHYPSFVGKHDKVSSVKLVSH